MRRAAILAYLVALAAPGGALGHARLKESTPTFEERLKGGPVHVDLEFDQKVTVIPKAVRVLDGAGHGHAGPSRLSEDGHEMSAAVGTLERGGYTVRWQALSRDGHVVSGVYTFGVRQKAPEVTAAYGASGPTALEDAVRWLAFVALALVLGGLFFRLVIVRGDVPPGFERRWYLLTLAGAVGVLEVGLLAFLLRADDALQLPFSRFLYGDLSPIARSPFGSAFVAMTLGFVLVGAFVFLAWLTRKRWLLWTAFAIALGFASGFSLSGHSASEPNSSRWSELADWIHLSAASVWAGGVVMLLLAFLTARQLGRSAFVRFARIAPVLIALLIGAGVYLSILRLPELNDLWTTRYGQVLLVKLALVALALAWGAAHHFLVEPHLDRPRVLARVPRSLAGEAAVGMAVLLLAAVLVNSAPPPSVEGPQQARPAAASP